VIYGDGSQTRDFVHVEDAVEAFLKAMDTKPALGVFNVGTGRETSLNALADVVTSSPRSRKGLPASSPRPPCVVTTAHRPVEAPDSQRGHTTAAPALRRGRTVLSLYAVGWILRGSPPSRRWAQGRSNLHR